MSIHHFCSWAKGSTFVQPLLEAAIEGSPLQSLMNASSIRMPDAANENETVNDASKAIEAHGSPQS